MACVEGIDIFLMKRIIYFHQQFISILTPWLRTEYKLHVIHFPTFSNTQDFFSKWIVA